MQFGGRSNIANPSTVARNFIRKRGLDQFMKILELKQSGKTNCEIARYFNVSEPRILRIVQSVLMVEYSFKPQVIDTINHCLSALDRDVQRKKKQIDELDYRGEIGVSGKMIGNYKPKLPSNVIPFKPSNHTPASGAL